MYLVIHSCPGGLVWIDKWNALQHPLAASFLAVLYSDYMLTSRVESISCSGSSYSPTDLRDFAKSQVCLCTSFDAFHNLFLEMIPENQCELSHFFPLYSLLLLKRQSMPVWIRFIFIPMGLISSILGDNLHMVLLQQPTSLEVWVR